MKNLTILFAFLGLASACSNSNSNSAVLPEEDITYVDSTVILETAYSGTIIILQTVEIMPTEKDTLITCNQKLIRIALPNSGTYFCKYTGSAFDEKFINEKLPDGYVYEIECVRTVENTGGTCESNHGQILSIKMLKMKNRQGS